MEKNSEYEKYPFGIFLARFWIQYMCSQKIHTRK